MEFLGLRTLVYPTANLDQSKDWWKNFLGIDPYFDQPFYVGFNVGGYELGLNPAGSLEHGPVTYIGVDSMPMAISRAQAQGATVEGPPQDVGEGIEVATLLSATGERFGLIVNPNFRLP
ncbi:glyoxalase-like domain protein [mine drainage metagenome]|uniref:Glyoxalase-like domain protein n=1 Tax=mine drainage metagenome TaxID=410659 RepID=A0A1J5PT49_9ZZZZ